MKICHSRKERGFSLVEVTIAMAIAAVAMVTLMGMIPQGMSTMREAGDAAIEARIHQQVMNELQMAIYDEVKLDYDQLVVYYDGQGEEIGDSKSGYRSQDDFAHIYSAKISLPDSGGALPESVGGGSFAGFGFGDGSINTEIRMVVIEVAVVSGQGRDFVWTTDVNQNLISTYQTSLVKMGR